MEFRNVTSHWSTEYHSRQHPNFVEKRDMCYRLEDTKNKDFYGIIESDDDSMSDDDDDSESKHVEQYWIGYSWKR